MFWHILQTFGSTVSKCIHNKRIYTVVRHKSLRNCPTEVRWSALKALIPIGNKADAPIATGLAPMEMWKKQQQQLEKGWVWS